MRSGSLTRLIDVLKHPNAIILQDDFVVVRIADCGIKFHLTRLSPQHRLRASNTRNADAEQRIAVRAAIMRADVEAPEAEASIGAMSRDAAPSTSSVQVSSTWRDS
ncbi:MAG: hypothetical protein WKF73_11135 [Nocardioidaceae bacterium]